MKRLRILLAYVLLATLAACAVESSVPSAAPHQTVALDPTRSFVEGQLIVGYATGHDPARFAGAIGGTVVQDWPAIRASLLSLPAGLTPAKAERLLGERPGFRYAIPNRAVVRDPVVEAPAVRSDDLGAAQTGSEIPDPEFGLQWMHRQLETPAAWVLGVTGSGIRIGIHDDYIDIHHPDLEANIFLPGYDGNLDELIVAETPHDALGTHGTSVAGTAAAVSNDIGGLGVAPDAAIVPLNISAPATDGGSVLTTSAIVNAAIFAALGPDGRSALFVGSDTDNAPGGLGYVHVLNMSWGGGAYEQVIKDALDFMLLHRIVLVTSAGNQPNNAFNEPAWLPGLITVAASDPTGGRTFFSNRGRHIDVAAPGLGVWTTETRPCLLVQTACDVATVPYRFANGTSFSSPAAAGVAALVMDALATRAPDGALVAVPAPAAVRRILSQTASRPDGGIFDEDIGFGVVNAEAAVRRALELTPETAPNGASLAVDVVTSDLSSSPVPNVGLTLIPADGAGATKYAQTSDGSVFSGFEGAGFFLEVDPGRYLLLVSGPHSATTGAEAAIASRHLVLEAGAFGSITVALDIELFEDPYEPNDTIADATPIEAGTTRRAALFDEAAASDVDVYALPVTSGVEYWINYETVSGDADAAITILAADGVTELAFNDSYRREGEVLLDDPALRFTPVASETVYLVIDAAENGPFNVYELDVSVLAGSESEPNGTATQAGATIEDPIFTDADAIALGQALTGAIDVATDVDLFEVALAAGSYYVDLETEVNLEPDTVVAVFDATGAVVAQNDDYDAQDSRVQFDVATAGTFYIGVSDYYGGGQESTGPYIVSLTASVAPAPVAP